MKKITLFTLLFSVLFTVQAQTLPVDGVTYSVDTLENHQVGPGTQYVALRLTANNRLDVFFLKTDLKNPHIQIKTALGRDSIYTGEPVSAVAKRKSTEGAIYFAGTNGDFYVTQGYVGYPIGGSLVEGEIAKTPITWNAFMLDDAKIPEIGLVTYSGVVKSAFPDMTIHSINHLRGENQLVLFNKHNGQRTRTNMHGTEVLVKLQDGYNWATNRSIKAVVISKEMGVGNMLIPKNQAVLSGHGAAAAQLNNLNVNDEIEIQLNLAVNGNTTSNFTAMTGGDSYAQMLKNGVVEGSNIWNERHPRTGLGYSQHKDSLIFCVVDGRGVSAGVTTKQLAEIMKSAGAYNAFNMDGGGSSTMYVAEYGKAVNRTSDGNERAVANSIFVVSTAPTDNNVGIIKPYESRYQLPYLGEYTPKFYAYNQYGVLLDSDLQGVVLSCPASLGTIQGNKFIATGNTPGKITATYNGNVVTTIDISFIPVSSIKIRLDSVLMDNRKDYPIEVMAVTDAGEAPISPAAFTWNVEDESVCTVTNGVAKALKNGKTKLTGKINDVQDEIMVHAEIPSAAQIIGDSLLLGDWTMTASSFLNAKWNEDNRPATWETGSVVNFVHAAGRAPFIKLTNRTPFYGLPDTVKLVMNIGNMAISRAIFSFLSNVSTRPVTTEFNTFVQNSDFSLDVPLDLLFDTNDRANYPIAFDNVNFYLDAANQVSQQAYSLAVKEIALVYKDYVITAVPNTRSTSFHVYPNPVKDELLIRVDDRSVKPTNAQLYDLSGKLVKAWKLNAGQSEVLSLGMSDVKQATYLLQLSTDEKQIGAVKIVKQ